MSVIYKQWYQSRNKPKTIVSNSFHLKYIATRDGVIFNEECGFGLWGRLENKDFFPRDIINLNTAMKTIRETSKTKTIYRAVVSLKEETAIEKNITTKDRWQKLVINSINIVAKENKMDIKDLRYVVSYHQEQGHPHCHIMFWDDSSKVREEYLTEEYFKIASEKIRTSFNKDIYADEILEQYQEQKTVLKDLRNTVKYESVFKLDDMSLKNMILYPKKMIGSQSQLLYENLMKLNYSVSNTGQLKYAYLSKSEKELVNNIVDILFTSSSLGEGKKQFLNTVKNIAEKYGNENDGIDYQIRMTTRKLYTELGNEILLSLKNSTIFDDRNIQDHLILADKLSYEVDVKINLLINAFMDDSNFRNRLEEVACKFPKQLTPMSEILKNPEIKDCLKTLTQEILNDDSLAGDLKLKNKIVSNAEEKMMIEIEKPEYKKVWNQLYDYCQNYNHYESQQNYYQVCKFFSTMSSLSNVFNMDEHSPSRNMKAKVDLSKQAKKEFAIKSKNKSIWTLEM